MKVLRTILLLLLLSISASATDYYASTDGSGATCSEGSPCSINTVMTKGSPGDNRILRAGTYTVDENTWNSMTSGSDFNSGAITVRPFTAEIVTLIGVVGDHVVNLKKGQHHVIFQDLVIDGVDNGSSLDGVKITGDGSSSAMEAHHFRFLRCEIKRTKYSGILIAPAYANSCQGNEFLYCYIHDTGTRNLDHGIYVESGYNIVDHCNIGPIPFGYGIQLDNTFNGDGNIFRLNWIHGCSGAAGIIFSGDDSNKAYDNWISDGAWGINADAGTNTGIYNNTIYGVTYPLYFYDGSNPVTAKNNVLVGNVGSQCINVESGSATHIIQYNLCLKTNGADGTINNTGSGGSSQITNNITTGTAAFVNAAGSDFHIQTSSTAKDAGIDLSAQGFSTDYDGGARPFGAAWDMGADEFGSTALAASALNGKITLSGKAVIK